MSSDVIDYKVYGNDLQYVEIELDPNETVVGEAGSMMYMTEGIEFEAKMGDGSNANESFFDKVFNIGKRLLTRESLFLTHYTHTGEGKAQVAFSAPYPGKIVPLDLSTLDNKIICQKDSFLCAARGTSIQIEFAKRIGAGFFGGEGFILQKLEGDGVAFVHACGAIAMKKLSNETLKVDSGSIVAFTQGIDYDVKMVKGLKSMLFSGEGLFLATLSGSGYVWLQSLPFSRLADRIISASKFNNRKGEERSFSVVDMLKD